MAWSPRPTADTRIEPGRPVPARLPVNPARPPSRIHEMSGKGQAVQAPRFAIDWQRPSISARYTTIRQLSYPGKQQSTLAGERDGKHAAGGIVDAPQANTSPEQVENNNESRAEKRGAEGRRDRNGRDDWGRPTSRQPLPRPMTFA